MASRISSQEGESLVQEAICQAFHPVADNDTVTVLTFKVPEPIILADEPTTATTETVEHGSLQPDNNNTHPGARVEVSGKEAFFHICLDISGSMAGSGINCAKVAMKQLIDHLEASGVSGHRITVHVFNSSCTSRRWGERDDDHGWLSNLRAGGGTKFESVFRSVIDVARQQRQDIAGREKVEMDLSLFFFTDGMTGDISAQQVTKVELEDLLKNTTNLETTVHTFGFTPEHDAKLLSWLTSIGTNVGCFQYIRASREIERAMATTLDLIGDNAMQVQRKIEIALIDDDDNNNNHGREPRAEDWIIVKLEKDGASGSTVVRDRVFHGSTIIWREHEMTDVGNSDSSNSRNNNRANIVRNMSIKWLPEEGLDRVLGMTTFIQYELLRMVEAINTINGSSLSVQKKRDALLVIDNETEAYDRALGSMAFASARNKIKVVREACMDACGRTRALVQSFMSLKADAHKQGNISNTSLATFNSLAYGGITERKLKAKLDARAGKNSALFADIDTKVAEIVANLDFEKMEAEESEETKRELSCAFSTNSYIEALQDGDCLCMTLDVTRSASAIADASQLHIKSIFPTYLTSSMFTMALGHALASDSPENVHGGFRPNSNASIAPGLAHENITAVMPIYINQEHWEVARLRMKPILGYVVTLDATGYTYSQSTTVPFLVLAKAIEGSHPMTEFKARQFQLILDTCDAIYRNSKSLRESTKTMVNDILKSHVNRTVDVIVNNYIFLGHVLCALRAGDLTAEEMALMMPQFETAMVEEQIRRDISFKALHLMGNILDWFNGGLRKEIMHRGEVYRKEHAEYVKTLDGARGNEAVEQSYRNTFHSACKKQLSPEGAFKVLSLLASSPDVTTSLAVAEASKKTLTEPELEIPKLDLAWELSSNSRNRLQSIQMAVSESVDKILRLLTLISAGPSNEKIQEALKTSIGAIESPGLATRFFDRFPDKVNLATMLQSYAHCKNADRRGANKIVAPFQYTRLETAPLIENDESLQYIDSLHRAKVTQLVEEIVTEVQEVFRESQKNVAASIFCSTQSLEAAAGLLLEAGTRGKSGLLVTTCAQRRMQLAREKILMLVEGKFKGIRLFSDKCNTGVDILHWNPCKQTLYRMFTNHHEAFSLREWRQFHPIRFDEYLACRYVLDNVVDELSAEERKEARETFIRTRARPLPLPVTT
ncbi:hypothetical protein BG004_006993 [Podila humilis]|nr:hypothetical protein BG004_006993 [Podila humilis]